MYFRHTGIAITIFGILIFFGGGLSICVADEDYSYYVSPEHASAVMHFEGGTVEAYAIPEIFVVKLETGESYSYSFGSVVASLTDNPNEQQAMNNRK